MTKVKRTSTFLLLIPFMVLIAVVVMTKTVSKVGLTDACGVSDYTGVFDPKLKEAFYDGKKITVPSIALTTNNSKVLGETADSNKWIEVNLKEQKLKAWDGNTLFLETPVSTGLPWTPTPTGEFRIWIKLRYTKMEGGSGKYYYNLPNVPYVMFFENKNVPGWKGYGLHGTYWHNDFGRVHSHGCVNLPTPMAEKLYYWVGPVLTSGKSSIYSSADNPGTRIVIHD